MKKILLLAVLGLFALAATAQDYSTVVTTVDIPTDLASASNGTSNSTSGVSFKVPQHRDLIIQCTSVAAGAGTSNTVFGFDFTVDGTTWTTTQPVTVTNANTGTTAVSNIRVISRTNVTGFARGRFSYLSTTQTNAVTVSGIAIGAAKFPEP